MRLVPCVINAYSIGLILFVTLLQGCASMSSRSNDETLGNLAGKDIIVSTPAKQLDLDLVMGSKNADKSVLRLVDEIHYTTAFRDNGRQTGPNLVIKDPSVAISKSLVKYFSAKYQLKTVGHGTIKNIDAQFLNRALKQGELVFDIRISELQLLPADTAGLYFLQAEYQFSVIDHINARVVIADHCAFNTSTSAKKLSFYSSRNGANITALLQQHASDCLQYFVLGQPEPMVKIGAHMTPAKQPRPTPKPVEKQTPSNTTVRSSADGSLQLLIGSALTRYPRNGSDALYRNSYQAGFELNKALAGRTDFTVQVSAVTNAMSATPGFSFGNGYGAQLALGTTLHSQKNPARGVQLLARGQIGQYLQQGSYLGTTALAAEIRGFTPLFGNLSIAAGYGLVRHLGPVDGANELGHQLDVQLRYRLQP